MLGPSLIHLLLRGLLGFNSSLLAHGGENDNVGVLLLDLEKLVDLLTNLAIGHLHIILGVAVVVHEGEKAVIRNVQQLVLTTGDIGDIHVVSGGREIFVLLASENVEGDQMDLGMTVLASLGSRHVDNLAGAVLDNNEAVLAQSRALHGVGQRRTSIGGIEGNIVLHEETSEVSKMINCKFQTIVPQSFYAVSPSRSVSNKMTTLGIEILLCAS